MKRFLFFSILSIFCLTASAQDWVQFGNEMNGSVMGDYFGASAALSADGNTLSVGAPRNMDGGNKAGQVKVFTFNGTSWVQKGDNINGQASLENIEVGGISADGNTIAIKAYHEYYVTARIYDFNGTTWTQRGLNIDGPNDDQIGSSLSMSADGERVILSYAGYSNRSGWAQVFSWNGTSWTTLGTNILGGANGDRFGYAVKLSADGNTFIASASSKDEVKIYGYNGTEWLLKGVAISGFGGAVDISGDGNTIIAGDGNYNSNMGRASIFSWNGTQWVQKGSDIVGLTGGDQTGQEVAMNLEGNIVATKGYGLVGNDRGSVRIYQFNGAEWIQLGESFQGDSGDTIGFGLDFSATGDIISIGNRGWNTTTGQMKVYKYNGPLSVSNNNLEFATCYPNPTNGNFTIDLGKEYTDVNVQIYNILGQLISSKKYTSAKNISNEITGAAGIYFVRVSTAKEVSNSLRVIKN